MKKNFIIIGIIILVLVIGLGFYIYINQQKQARMQIDYKNATYFIDNQPVTLVDGYAEQSIDDSAAKIVTRYFGNEATGDLNGDAVSDVAFLLVQDSGGSGTFYYLAAAIKTEAGYIGTNAILLGDRIAPQTTEFRDGQIIVNYATRRPNEPITAQASVGVSRYFKISDGGLVEIYR
ncbi:MAG: hypothetical protein JW816_04395 [Candidatus Buchananbacteria bacterium]|nr:hypothetical protein [Candidatus Buchananbacteria bacterium]